MTLFTGKQRRHFINVFKKNRFRHNNNRDEKSNIGLYLQQSLNLTAHTSLKRCLEVIVTMTSSTSSQLKNVLLCVRPRASVSLRHTRTANAICTLREGPLAQCMTLILCI